jgi:hypothetical protein
MAAGSSQMDVLSRVRREQRMHGKPSGFSGVRIVLLATGITLAILLFAFGAIGMLMMARAPQEPIASRLDPSQPFEQQTEHPVQVPQPLQQADEPQPQNQTEVQKQVEQAPKDDSKMVKTLRVVTPAQEPEPEPKKEEVAAKPEQPEPESTGSIPPAVQPQQKSAPQRAVQRPVYRQRTVRRQAPQKQTENPLLNLFGIKQYR